MTRAPVRERVLLSCEHAGKRVPPEYRARFRAAARELASHRGYDAGALAVARRIAAELELPLHAVAWSRLLVDANRSPSNPRIWSAFSADLGPQQRERILARYWWPHRREVEAAVAGLVARGQRVVHVAVHSFTPALRGELRRADIGLLYDPARAAEQALCARWRAILRELDPALRVRRNYPYRGADDGLTTWLRRRFPARCYAGIELELCQRLLVGAGRARIARLLAASLERLLRPRSLPATAAAAAAAGPRRSTSRRRARGRGA